MKRANVPGQSSETAERRLPCALPKCVCCASVGVSVSNPLPPVPSFPWFLSSWWESENPPVTFIVQSSFRCLSKRGVGPHSPPHTAGDGWFEGLPSTVGHHLAAVTAGHRGPISHTASCRWGTLAPDSPFPWLRVPDELTSSLTLRPSGGFLAPFTLEAPSNTHLLAPLLCL